MPVKINAEGLALIKRFEGCRLKAYRCPAGMWTIGYGHTGDVEPGTSITQHQAEVLLGYDLERFEAAVPDASPNQFSAMVSLAFNIGTAAFGASTLLKRFKEGKIQAAADQFPRWNKAGGKVLPGLVKRRAAERALFLRTP